MSDSSDWKFKVRCLLAIVLATFLFGCGSARQGIARPDVPICEGASSQEACSPGKSEPPTKPEPSPKPEPPPKPDKPDEPSKPAKDIDKQGRGEILRRTIEGIYFHFIVRCKTTGRTGYGASPNEDAALDIAFTDCSVEVKRN